MKRVLSISLILCTLAIGAVALPACHAPVTVTTPAGRAAFTANEVLTRVERLQDAAIAANKAAALDTPTARSIVFVTVQLAELADAATQGWQAAARQAWTQAKTETAALRPGGQFAVLAATIDEALGGVN